MILRPVVPAPNLFRYLVFSSCSAVPTICEDFTALMKYPKLVLPLDVGPEMAKRRRFGMSLMIMPSGSGIMATGWELAAAAFMSGIMSTG